MSKTWLRFLLKGGAFFAREFTANEASEIISNWMKGYYKMTPGKRFLGCSTGTGIWAIDTDEVICIHYLDYPTLTNQNIYPAGGSGLVR